MKRFQVIKNGTLFYVSDTLTLKSTEQGPFDSETECQSRADEMNAACDVPSVAEFRKADFDYFRVCSKGYFPQ